MTSILSFANTSWYASNSSAWRKLPDWSDSANNATSFAINVMNTQINSMQGRNVVSARAAVARIQAQAKAKQQAIQDAQNAAFGGLNIKA
jgi:hypothetical protein